MKRKVIEMKKEEWQDQLCKRIEQLEDTCNRKDKEIDDIKMETLSIISTAISELQRNNYGKPEIQNVKTVKTLEYLKQQHDILAEDIAIENDEKILELPITRKSIR